MYANNYKYTKTKIKLYDNNVNTTFHSKKIPKEKTACKCLSLIMLESVVKLNEEYYFQAVSEKWKYKIKTTKMVSFVNDELKASSSDNKSGNETDNESYKEPNNEIDKESENE